MFEREISLFPVPVAGWLTLKLSTADCQIFGKFQTAGSLVQRVFYYINPLVSLGIHCLMLFHKISHHLAQVHDSLLNWG